MMSSATAVQMPPRPTSQSPAIMRHTFSPINSDGHSRDSAANEQPLDFSKQTSSSQSSKSPPTSEEDEHHEPYQHRRNRTSSASTASPPPGTIDPIALTKSLAAAAYFPQHPKFIKNDHCFSTPSPSPPERTATHFGVSPTVTSVAPATANIGGDHCNMTTNAAVASQMFDLFSQLSAASQQQPSTAQPLLPLAAAANANAIANSNHQAMMLKQALQLAGATGGHASAASQQAALISALMQSAQLNNHTANSVGASQLELLKNLAVSDRVALSMQQQSSPGSAKMASPVAANHHAAFLMAAQHQQSPVTTAMTASSMSPTAAAIGLLSTATGTNGYLYPQHSSQSAIPSDPILTLSSTSGPVVDSTSSSHRGANGSRTTPPSKYTRPFKALYKDSFHAQSPFTPSMNIASTPSVATDSLATQSILLSNSDLAYQEFRNKMLHTKSPRASSERTHHEQQATRHLSKTQEAMDHHHHNSHHSDDNHSVTSSHSSSDLFDCASGGHDSHNGALSFHPVSTISAPVVNSSSSQSSSSPMISNGITTVSSAPITPIPSVTVARSNSSSGSNSGRKRGRPLPDEQKDDAYWERRRKNNEAAKRSRDLRRAKEDEIAIRAAFLEQENFKLKYELVQARMECEKMRTLWLSTPQGQQSASQLSPPVPMTADQMALAAVLQMKTSPK